MHDDGIRFVHFSRSKRYLTCTSHSVATKRTNSDDSERGGGSREPARPNPGGEPAHPDPLTKQRHLTCGHSSTAQPDWREFSAIQAAALGSIRIQVSVRVRPSLLATPSTAANSPPWTAGVGTTLQLLPLKCSASVALLLAVLPAISPTAQMSLSAIAAVPLRLELLTNGLGTTCRACWPRAGPAMLRLIPMASNPGNRSVRVAGGLLRWLFVGALICFPFVNDRALRGRPLVRAGSRGQRTLAIGRWKAPCRSRSWPRP